MKVISLAVPRSEFTGALRTPAIPRWLFPLVLALALAARSDAQNPFRNLLTGPEYQRQAAELESEIADFESLMEMGLPGHGLRVLSVIPGRMGESIGVQPGDVIHQIDKHEVWSSSRLPRELKPQVLHLINNDDGHKSLEIEPLKLGVELGAFDHPAIDVLKRFPDRRPGWYRDLCVASLCWRENFPLAETAWHRIMEKGYQPDALSSYFTALFRLHEPTGADRETNAFLEHFASPAEIPSGYLSGLVPLLIAAERLDVLGALARQRTPMFMWSPERIEEMEAWRDSKLSPPGSLLDRAATMRTRELSGQLLELHRDTGMETSLKLPSKIDVPSGHYRRYTFAPEETLNSFHLRLKSTVTSHDPHPIFWNTCRINVVERSWALGLYDEDDPDYRNFSEAGLVMAMLQRNPAGDALVFTTCGGSVYMDVPTPHLNLDTKADQSQGSSLLDIVRIDNQLEVYFNGIRYLRMPVDPERDDVAFSWHTSGARLEDIEFELFELQ